MSSIWDDLDKKASEDNRIGNQDFLVDSVSEDTWPDGRKYFELNGRLTSANDFNIKQRFSPAPSEEQVKAIIDAKDQRVIRSANLAHQNDVVLQAEYGTSIDKVKAGDSFRVKTDYETKDGKKYVRVIRFLPKTEALGANGSSKSAPF